MLQSDPVFLDIVRDSRVVSAIISVYKMDDNGNMVEKEQLKIVEGSIDADRDGVSRRTLSCTVAFESWEYGEALLDVIDTRLQVWGGVDGGARQLLVPLGVFRLDTVSRGGRQILSLTGSSLECYVADYTFYHGSF